MAMDGLALRAMVQELQPLVGGKIDKVQQPERDTLLLTVRAGGANRRLLVCTHAENGRMQLTDRAFDNPVQAPAFCMLLRRHLLGGRITEIAQDGPDRTCVFSVAARNELMDDVQLRLVVELMGKHANVILVGGDGRILDALRHISPSETTQRVLLPGFTFAHAPGQGKQDPFLADAEAFAGVFSGGAPVRQLTDRFEGVSRGTASALIARCPDADSLTRAFAAFRGGAFHPCVLYDDADTPIAALPFLCETLGASCAEADTMSAALDRYYTERDALVRMRRHSASLRRTVENALGRLNNKLRSFEEAISGDEALESSRTNGELILANLHLLRPGQSRLVCENYYTDPPETCEVPLDPALSGQDNARRYFKQYRKGKLSRDYALSQQDAVRAEIDYLESIAESLETCQTQSELQEIRDELIAQKYAKPERKAGKQQFAQPSRPMRYASSDGIPILVGKNNRQNDSLTLKTARPENLWLHAKNMPGSHVIVLCDGMPPERTLLEAATLAACFCGGKTATTVPVDYTLRRNVKKPSGARPGMVIYSTNQTVHVAPDQKLIAALKREEA